MKEIIMNTEAIYNPTPRHRWEFVDYLNAAICTGSVLCAGAIGASIVHAIAVAWF